MLSIEEMKQLDRDFLLWLVEKKTELYVSLRNEWMNSL